MTVANAVIESAKKIKLLLLDVDGVLDRWPPLLRQ